MTGTGGSQIGVSATVDPAQLIMAGSNQTGPLSYNTSVGAGYGNLIPPMPTPNFNPGGGYMPTPLGGQWNQLAQQMAGPMFMPPGTSVLGGASNPTNPFQPSGVTVPPIVGPGVTPKLPTNGPYSFNPGLPPTNKPPTVPPTLPPNGPNGNLLGLLGNLGNLGGYGGGLNGDRVRFERF